MSSLPLGCLLRHPLGSPPTSSCLAGGPGACSMLTERPKRHSHCPISLSLIMYQSCRPRLTVMPTIQEHLQVAQAEQSCTYNHSAQPREFKLGEHMLLLFPSASCKFLTHWQDPYTIMERVSPVNYSCSSPVSIQNYLKNTKLFKSTKKLYHVNLLKHWFEPRPALTAGPVSLCRSVMQVHMEEYLTPNQQEDGILRTSLGTCSWWTRWIHFVQHVIKTPPHAIVRQ